MREENEGATWQFLVSGPRWVKAGSLHVWRVAAIGSNFMRMKFGHVAGGGIDD